MTAAVFFLDHKFRKWWCNFANFVLAISQNRDQKTWWSKNAILILPFQVVKFGLGQKTFGFMEIFWQNELLVSDIVKDVSKQDSISVNEEFALEKQQV